jgi:ubiquinone/menaquinone biosynthesis C-methylase UbiE
MVTSIKKFWRRKSAPTEKGVIEAYDIWSEHYDSQPGNLMLALDNEIFSALLTRLHLENKMIADIGCGTGRHWKKLYSRKPSVVAGFDVSAGMLKNLILKYPGAVTRQIIDNRFANVPDACFDVIVTTLTIAHIADIDEAIAAWSRILRPGGDLIITDFHPETLAKGGSRSFTHRGKTLSVVNYIHPLDEVIGTFRKHNLVLQVKVERSIDERVRHYYAAQNALPVYEQFKGTPVIYGMHLRKTHAAQ